MKKEGQKFTEEERAEWEQAIVRLGLPYQGIHVEFRQTEFEKANWEQELVNIGLPERGNENG